MLEEEVIEQSTVSDILPKYFLDYAVSVNISRSIPDVRDGLKPVHRRILYAMHKLPTPYNRPHKKAARTVGEVIGKYHPHGDSSVYDAMARMTQEWKMRLPLVDGHGNFGSIDGDAVAAMRYTEARLLKAGHEIVGDLDSDTVEFQENFDGEEKEPVVLPSKIPNLLVNGTGGIAVGMATTIPPHNLREVTDAVLALLENRDLTIEEIMEIMPGPDFPTGGVILQKEGVEKAYRTGVGTFHLRGTIEQDFMHGREALVITEIPYQVVKTDLIRKLKDIQATSNEAKRLIKKGQRVTNPGLDYLADIRDETDNDTAETSVRIVLELKNGVNPDVVRNYIFKNTPLQISFSVHSYALVPDREREGNGKKTSLLNLKEMLEEYIAHQREVMERKLNFELRQAKNELSKLEAVVRALDNLDETLRIIRESDEESLKPALCELLGIDEKQAEHLLQIRLRRLASFEQDRVRGEHDTWSKKVEELLVKLSSQEEMDQLIREQLVRIQDDYGDDRRTEISSAAADISAEEMIPSEDVVVTMSRNGFIKRMGQDAYKMQKKSGRGIRGMDTFEDDFVSHLKLANTHDTLMFFTNKGSVYKAQAYQIPATHPKSKGVSIRTLFDFNDNEYVQAILSVKTFFEAQYIVIGTKKGLVKRTKLSEYNQSNRNGIRGITLNAGDEVVNVSLTEGDKLLSLVTQKGLSITFKETDVKVIGRTGKGSLGMQLKPEDQVISLSVHLGFSELFVATEKGMGKRTPLAKLRVQNRNGKGVRLIATDGRNGPVVGTVVVEDEDTLILLTKQGTILKMKAGEMTTFSRTAKGSRVINLKQGDVLQAIDRHSEDQAEEE